MNSRALHCHKGTHHGLGRMLLQIICHAKLIIITFFKLQFHSHITKIQLYVSLKLGKVQLAVKLTT